MNNITTKAFKDSIIKQAQETTKWKSFLGGVEPTGKWTIDQASKNDKNQSTHRNLATVGGGIGGFMTGAALSGAALLGGGKILSKMRPDSIIGRSLARSGEASIKSLNPAYTYKKLKGLPEAAKITKAKGDFIGKVSPQFSKLDNAPIESALNIKTLTNARKSRNEFRGLLAKDRSYKKKYKVDSTRGVEEGVGVLSGLLGGTTAGGLGAISARAQYNAGDKMRKERDKK